MIRFDSQNLVRSKLVLRFICFGGHSGFKWRSGLGGTASWVARLGGAELQRCDQEYFELRL